MQNRWFIMLEKIDNFGINLSLFGVFMKKDSTGRSFFHHFMAKKVQFMTTLIKLSKNRAKPLSNSSILCQKIINFVIFIQKTPFLGVLKTLIFIDISDTPKNVDFYRFFDKFQ